MRQKKQMTPKSSADEAIKDIRRATRRHWSAEDKIAELAQYGLNVMLASSGATRRNLTKNQSQ